jgi:DNA-binding transcriptional regulator YdaS (Cro superfamily)
MNITMTEIITQICKPNGGVTHIAKALGISRQAIYQWKEIPPKHLVALEKITGVPRAEMRRDLYE